jgi:hypothetical protein
MAPANKIENSQMITKIIKIIIEICEMYGYRPDTRRRQKDLFNSIEHWRRICDLDTAGSWMKLGKYKTAAFFAYHIKEETLPTLPFENLEIKSDHPGKLLTGGAGRFISHLVASGNLWKQDGKTPSRGLSFLSTINCAKKGMPRPTKSMLEKERIDTITELLKPQPLKVMSLVSWGDYDEGRWGKDIESPGPGFSIHELETQVERAIDEIFGRTTKHSKGVQPIFPSVKSNVVFNRLELGTLGSLRETIERNNLSKYGGYLKVTQINNDEYNNNEEKISNEQINSEGGTIKISTSSFNDAYATVWNKIRLEADEEYDNGLETQAVALSEPFKVRVINKGPPNIYHILRPLQRVLHSKLREHRVFQLIGKPCTPSILEEVLGKRLKDNEIFISGDYKAATNKLISKVSELIAKQIAKNLELSALEEKLFIAALTGHTFIDKKGKKLGKQQNGQLMGSIISFPILCLANAILCRWAMELGEGRNISFNDIRLLINGDDVLMKTIPKVYTIWKKLGMCFGLEESLGKTYVNRRILQINSQNYLFDHEGRTIKIAFPDGLDEMKVDLSNIRPHTTDHYIPVPFVNLGLLKGMKKSAAKEDTIKKRIVKLTDLGTNLKKLLENAPLHLHSKLRKIFMTQHKDILSISRIPYFLPKWIGGLGLPVDDNHQPSDLDKRLAQKILFNWNSIKPVQINETSGWKMRTIVEKRLPKPISIEEVDKDRYSEEIKNFDTVSSLATFDLLFDKDLTSDDLYDVDEDERIFQAIKHNARLYCPEKGSLPSPLTNEDLVFKKKYSGYRVLDEDEPLNIKIKEQKNIKINEKLNKNQKINYKNSVIIPVTLLSELNIGYR